MIDKRIFALGLFALASVSGCRGVDIFESSRAVVFQPTVASTMNDQSESKNQVRQQSPYYEPASSSGTSYPIDFPTVLRLAGADNWNVKLARQRVKEASADYCIAKSEWMPSITLGLGYNNHEGQIQETEGDVLTVSRNSLFVGGGAGIQNSPLNGGSSGPPRMFVDLSLAEAIFKPLSARRLLGAEQARQNRVFNDTMLQASLAYYDLVRAQSQLAIAQTNLSEAEEVAQLTEAFVEGGKGTQADTSRIAVIVNNRRQQQVIAESELKIASARLANILQMDPTKLNPESGLVAMEADPVPMHLTSFEFDLSTTIQQAQSLRCEIAEANAKTHSARAEMMAEQWRPWLPNLYVGYSGGLFGGGQGGDLPNLDGRSDLDVVMNWQVKNMGVGTRARQDATRSRMYQRNFEMQQIRDQIAEQVTTTYQRVTQYRTMIGLLSENIEQAGQGLEKNLAAIKGLEGLPLEAIASLEQLATARTDYLASVVNYNQWQIRLLRAAGQSLAADAELGSVASCNANGCDVDLPDCPCCFEKPSRCKCSRLNPVRALGNRVVSRRVPDSGRSRSADRGCQSCGSSRCGLISGRIGRTEGYFQDNGCGCSDSSSPGSIGIGSPYVGREQEEPRLTLGRPLRTAWYEADVSDEPMTR